MLELMILTQGWGVDSIADFLFTNRDIAMLSNGVTWFDFHLNTEGATLLYIQHRRLQKLPESEMMMFLDHGGVDNTGVENRDGVNDDISR